MPRELYDLLVYIGTPSRYVIKHVFRNDDLDQPVAVTSTSRLSLIAGRYVGKDDPIMMVLPERPARGRRGARAVRQPAPGGRLDARLAQRTADALPHGDEPASSLRRPSAGGRHGLPARRRTARRPARPARQRLLRSAREQALEMADYIRRMGPFEPASAEAMEYTTPATSRRTPLRPLGAH